jgi:hypothetical protein
MVFVVIVDRLFAQLRIDILLKLLDFALLGHNYLKNKKFKNNRSK